MKRFLLSFVYCICIFFVTTLSISASNPSLVGQQDAVKQKLLGVQNKLVRNSQELINFSKYKQYIILGQKPEISSEETLENSQPKSENEPRVLISEVVVVGENLTPELEKLVYETTSTNPGHTTTRSQLQEDVNAVYSTGFFQNVELTPRDTPLGVRITFVVELNPILNEVVVETLPKGEASSVLPTEKANEIFGKNYGQILNLRTLKDGITKINEWYSKNGYELAQVVGSPQVSSDGKVTLVVAEGIIEDIQVRYFDEEDELSKGNIRDFIITQEIELKSGDVFKRDTAQKDLQRVFGLGIFEDVRLSFNPGEDPSKIVINLEVVEIKPPFKMAEKLITLKKKEYLQEAFNIYQQEIQKYQSPKDLQREGILRAKLASAYREFGNLEQAISLYNQSLSLLRMSQKHSTSEAQPRSELEYLEDTNSLGLQVYGLSPQFDELLTLVNQAEIYRLLGDYQQAFDSLKKAKILWEHNEDSLLQITGEDFLIFNQFLLKEHVPALISASITSIYSDLGLASEAFYYQQEAQRKLKKSFPESIKQINQQFKELFGDDIDIYSISEEDIEKELAHIKNQNQAVHSLLTYFTYFYLPIKQFYTEHFKILQMKDEEIELFSKHSTQSIPIVKVLERELINYRSELLNEEELINRGEQALIMGDNQQALIHYHEALKLLLKEEKQIENENQPLRKIELDKLNNITKQADVLNRIAQIHWSLAETSQAFKFYQQALALFQKTDNFQGQIDTLIFMGQIYVNSAQYETTLTYYEQAYQVSKRSPVPSLEAKVLFEKAVVKRIQGNYIEAKELIETALNRLEFQRCVGQDNQQKLVRGACPEIFTPFSETKSIRFKSYINLASYFESKQKYYEFYIDLLMEIARQDTKSDYSIQALKASEDNRARSLIALLNSARSNSQEIGQKTTNIKFAESLKLKEIQEKVLDKNTVLLELRSCTSTNKLNNPGVIINLLSFSP